MYAQREVHNLAYEKYCDIALDGVFRNEYQHERNAHRRVDYVVAHRIDLLVESLENAVNRRVVYIIGKSGANTRRYSAHCPSP